MMIEHDSDRVCSQCGKSVFCGTIVMLPKNRLNPPLWNISDCYSVLLCSDCYESQKKGNFFDVVKKNQK